MLPKKHRLTKKKDFEKVFKSGHFFSENFVFLRQAKNNLAASRFGFIVSTKISNKAVVRNKIRRQLREIIKIHLKDIKNGFDVALIVRPEIIKEKYGQIEKTMLGVLKKSELLKISNAKK